MPPVPRLQISDRRAAAARRRRRRGRMRLAGLIIALVLVVLIIADTAGGSSHTTGTRTSAVNHARTRPATSTSARTTSPTDPLTTAQMKRLLARRGDQVSAAVYDIRTGQEWTLKPGLRNQTASIVKADILETLLYQDRDDLDDAETDTAQDMIEASDNDDASDLYTAIGGPSGLDAYDARIGMKITLLKQLSLPGSVLPAAAVHYQLSLMENIDPGENWGVTGGVPSSGVTVALKNGWVPLTSNADWEVNSIGWVDGDKHDYLIAVMTAHDSSEDYGINTIDAMSKLIYDTIGPAPSAGPKTITVTPTG
jgi:hypothetical protein